MKPTKSVNLPKSTWAALKPLNKGVIVNEAVTAAANDPTRLSDALTARLIDTDADTDTHRSSIGVTAQDLESLQTLSALTDLTQEAVLRLALEARLAEMGRL